MLLRVLGLLFLIPQIIVSLLVILIAAIGL